MLTSEEYKIKVRLRRFVELNKIDARIQGQSKNNFDTRYPLESTFEVEIIVPEKAKKEIIDKLKEDDRIVSVDGQLTKGYDKALREEAACAHYGLSFSPR
jgi:hypothetical protein